jgi:hypothetical protein
MTEDDYARTLDELDRLLNDPNVPMQPGLIWRLLDKISGQDLPGVTMLSRIMAHSRDAPITQLPHFDELSGGKGEDLLGFFPCQENVALKQAPDPTSNT